MTVDMEKIHLKMIFKRGGQEAVNKWLEYKKNMTELQSRHARMDSDTFANAVEFCIAQMTEDRGGGHRALEYGPGTPVYNALFWHTLMPEIMKRLRRV